MNGTCSLVWSVPVGGVVSMVRGENQKIVLPQKGKQLSQLLIKALQLPAVPFRIATVSPQGVKIHQIHKTKPVEIRFSILDGLLHAVDR